MASRKAHTGRPQGRPVGAISAKTQQRISSDAAQLETSLISGTAKEQYESWFNDNVNSFLKNPRYAENIGEAIITARTDLDAGKSAPQVIAEFKNNLRKREFLNTTDSLLDNR